MNTPPDGSPDEQTDQTHREADAPLRVLVTGATGYVGSRLIPVLLEAGHRVDAGSRSSMGTADYPWHDEVETSVLDIDDDDAVATAVEGVDVVVYLVHSMDSDDFVRQDREAAERMSSACAAAGVKQVVYLSGLVPPGETAELSDHLRSRLEVEEVFLDGPVPAAVLRASMVIGAGSTSFELLRRLSRRVPLITPVPAWMSSSIQPVSIDDVTQVIAAVVDHLVHDGPINRHYDVGGEEVITYPELLRAFADVDGLHRRRVLVPGVPVWLVGRACALISQLPANEVRSLVASLKHDMVCREDAYRHLLPEDFAPTSIREALRRSLDTSGADGTSDDGDIQAEAVTDPA